MDIQVRKWKNIGREEKDRILLRSEAGINEIMGEAAKIVEAVRTGGDAALRMFTGKFDGVDLSGKPLGVTEEEFDAAGKGLPENLKSAIDFAVENVKRFHETQKPPEMPMVEIRPGLYAGEKAMPVPSAGLYVPSGRGSFPSMLYMLAVPAVIAGVPEIAVATPPAKDGSVDPAVLYAARACGLNGVYRVGGAQAVAALAYGTGSVPKVDMITGPGSRWVAAAKRVLHGTVDVGLPAGPSESVVLADETADPEITAFDVLNEAEHGSDSSALLVTPSEKIAREVSAVLVSLIADLPEPRRTFVSDVLSGYGGIIITDTMEEAAAVVNEFAPEHLLVKTAEPFDTLPLIRNAGEILLGPNVPFSLANYVTGPNAVLPTGGTARTWSAVSVRDFMKFSSVIHATPAGFRTCAPAAETLADWEGFPAHGNALRIRRRPGPA